MKRTVRLLSRFNVALLIPIGLAACGGKTASVGTSADELRSVDPASVNGVAPPCATNAEAHPNVCCKGGPTELSACVAYVNKPFHRCDADSNTYPDPGLCCDLSNPASCAPPPPPPPGGGHGQCGYVCPPGQFAGPGGGCCSTVTGPDGKIATVCTVSVGFEDAPPTSGGSAPPSAGPPEVDGGIAPPPPPPFPCAYPVQAGTSGGPSTGGNGPGPQPPNGPQCPPPPPPFCDLACPPGFIAAINDPAICCQDTPSGDICFSQAQGPSAGGGGGVSGGGGVPPVPTDVDAGTRK